MSIPTNDPNDSEERKAIIGNTSNFWLFSSKTGYDLTHPPTPTSPPISPRVTLSTTSQAIAIDPAKTALVIIDMQNFFLSPALGRKRGAGHTALDNLVQHAIPASRKADIRVVWLNWGLSEEEVEAMPPAIKKAFGFETYINEGESGLEPDGTKLYKGLGHDMGIAKDPDTGEEIQAGKMLMRDQWNTALCPPLDKLYEEGKNRTTKPDLWVHKNRMSGMWGLPTACEEVFQKEGIKTLLFSGVNTDQCVGGTYQDCFSKGYDCVLLSDGCGTTSPEFAQSCIEWNAANVWGFLTSCEALANGVASM